MVRRYPITKFLRVSRDYGFAVAASVAYSKIRGILRPSMALSDRPVYNNTERELTIILDAATLSPSELAGVTTAVLERPQPVWEVCMSEHSFCASDLKELVDQVRGSSPILRIISANSPSEDTALAQWTIEQSTGRYLGFVRKGLVLSAEIIDRIISTILSQPFQQDSIVLSDVGLERPFGSIDPDGQAVLLLRKPYYLSLFATEKPLTAASIPRSAREFLVLSGVP